jgi:hypothetical protein
MRRPLLQHLALPLFLAAAGLLGTPSTAQAVDAPKDKTQQPEEEDFSTTPFTAYGEFNEEENEEEELRFLQYGRYFGVSLGLGVQTLDGGRANIWEGGFPVFDFKIHYWFDFNLAMDMGFYTAKHSYNMGTALGGLTDVSIFHIGLDVKYYFDTKDIAAPITFANPYVIVGMGQFSKTETPENVSNQTSFSTFGASLGLGLEFAIRPKKTYFEVEAKAHFVSFPDDGENESRFAAFTDDFSGRFYTFTGSFLFTW